MINRWWTAVFALGLATCALAWGLARMVSPDEAWRWIALLNIGIFVSIVGLAMFFMRKSAYVQPFPDHLRLATPFLRLNISYKRIRRASTAQMNALFPPRGISNWRREIMEPLAHKTAVIIELNGFPTTQTVLKFFLSPFFFKDNTPHFILLVDDWMRFSSELESFRAGGDVPAAQRPHDPSILSRLPHK